MVTRKDQDVLGVVQLDVVKVLRDCVRGARVPCAARLRLVRRKDGDAAIAVIEILCLTGTDVGMQKVRTVLSQDTDGIDT